MSASGGFFIAIFDRDFSIAVFFYAKTRGTHMELELITNGAQMTRDAYKIARTVYAETSGKSLPLVEAFTSMIANIARARGIAPASVVADTGLFTHDANTEIDTTGRAFQMCLRTAQRMLRGNLMDASHGATRFHAANQMPDWAVSRGYIADVDGVLFYL